MEPFNTEESGGSTIQRSAASRTLTGNAPLGPFLP